MVTKSRTRVTSLYGLLRKQQPWLWVTVLRVECSLIFYPFVSQIPKQQYVLYLWTDVDLVRHIPSWMPGAGFKRHALKTRKAVVLPQFGSEPLWTRVDPDPNPHDPNRRVGSKRSWRSSGQGSALWGNHWPTPNRGWTDLNRGPVSPPELELSNK